MPLGMKCQTIMVATYNFSASPCCTTSCPFRTILDLAVPKLWFLRSCLLLYRLGPNGPNNKHSLEEHLWHIGSATSTKASLRVARLWLGWLPSQARLPQHDGQGRTWQICHCSWNVKSTIIKAELPQHKPGSPWGKLGATLGSPWNAYALCRDDALEIGKGWVHAAVKGA